MDLGINIFILMGIINIFYEFRNLQKFFIKCSQLELENVLSEIKSNITTLMTDTYANYMFQTLIQRCTPEQRLFILRQVQQKRKHHIKIKMIFFFFNLFR